MRCMIWTSCDKTVSRPVMGMALAGWAPGSSRREPGFNDASRVYHAMPSKLGNGKSSWVTKVANMGPGEGERKKWGPIGYTIDSYAA